MGNLDLDLDTIEEVKMDFDPLPKGEYLAEVTNSEVVPTKRGDGMILKLTFDVLEGDYKDRKIFASFNIANPSEKAQQIGRGQLKDLCIALGKSGIVNDSTELHGIPFRVRVKIETSEGYAPRNVPTSYAPAKQVVAAVKETSLKDDVLPF